MKFKHSLLTLTLSFAAAGPAAAGDLLVTQYKADPSGAPYAIALEKGFFRQHGVDVTDIVSGAGGGASVRSAIASDFGFGDVTAAAVIVAAEQGQDVKIVNITSRSLADSPNCTGLTTSPAHSPSAMSPMVYSRGSPQSE